MYNDPSAKDLLAAQYPRQYAEGGEATPFSNKAVVDLYTQNLGRMPDQSGYQYWNEKFGNEVSPEEALTFRKGVSENLSANPDAYRAQYGEGAFNKAAQYAGLAPSTPLPIVSPVLDRPLPSANPAANPVQSWQAPAVQAARTQLNQITPGLSASQQYARDRAAQDALLTSSYAQTGAAPLTNTEYRALQQQMRSGQLNPQNIQEQLINPIYEQRVANAYAAIGRTGPIVPAESINAPGATADTFKAVDKEGYDFWLNKLKSGEITGQQFQNAFLTSAAAVPTGTNAKLALDATNKARKALGMTEITEKDLPGYQAPKPVTPIPTYSPWNQIGYGIGNIANPIKNRILGSIPALNNIVAPAAPAAPTVVGNVTNPGQNNYTIKPIEFGPATGTGTTQLFNEGGAVKK